MIISKQTVTMIWTLISHMTWLWNQQTILMGPVVGTSTRWCRQGANSGAVPTQPPSGAPKIETLSYL